MGNPAFYLYPDTDGPLTVMDLGEGLSALKETPIPMRKVTQSADGRGWSSITQFNYEVAITLRAFGTPAASALERKLQLVANHLNRGGYVGFTADTGKTWGSILPMAPRVGDTEFTVAGNGFSSWSSNGVVAAGDEIVLETVFPESRRDIVTVTSLTGTALVTAEALRLTMLYQPVIRYRRLWPVLYMDPNDGEDAVDPVRTIGIAYDLTIRLRYSPSLAYQVANGGVPSSMGTSSVIGSGAVSVLGATSMRPTSSAAGSTKGATIESLLSPSNNPRRR